MHDETPSMKSARNSARTDERHVACSRHVRPKPAADHAISARRPITSESAQRKPTPRKVSALSTVSTSPLTLIEAGVTPVEPSGLTIDEMTRGRLGTLRPSERKYSQLCSSAQRKEGAARGAAAAVASSCGASGSACAVLALGPVDDLRRGCGGERPPRRGGFSCSAQVVVMLVQSAMASRRAQEDGDLIL